MGNILKLPLIYSMDSLPIYFEFFLFRKVGKNKLF